MVGTNAAALPVDTALFNMAEACSVSGLWTVVTIPAPEMKWFYVTIQQFVALCSQVRLKCCVTGPPKGGPAWTRKLDLNEAVPLLVARKQSLSEKNVATKKV